MRKIVITPRGFVQNGQEYIKLLEDNGFELDLNTSGTTYTHEAFRNHCLDAEGIILGVDVVDRALIDECKNLRIVVKYGAGVDNIDVEYCKEKGIIVERCAGANSRSVAETVIAYVMASSKRLYDSIKETKEGKWNKYAGFEVLDKTIGIIGFGAVGKNVAKMANGLGMKVLVNDAFMDENAAKEYNATVSSIETIIKTADFISLNVPLTDETRGMIGAAELSCMKKSAILINTARGGIVDENALYDALLNKTIAAAYFDVLETEPAKQGERLLEVPNFYLTPHAASRAVEAELRIGKMSADYIIKHLG